MQPGPTRRPNTSRGSDPPVGLGHSVVPPHPGGYGTGRTIVEVTTITSLERTIMTIAMISDEGTVHNMTRADCIEALSVLCAAGAHAEYAKLREFFAPLLGG